VGHRSSKNKSKVKGVGQECPTHTGKTNLNCNTKPNCNTNLNSNTNLNCNTNPYCNTNPKCNAGSEGGG
jgi:hypothetical protein